MPRVQPALCSKKAQQFAGTDLKIATDTAGTLRPFILINEREG